MKLSPSLRDISGSDVYTLTVPLSIVIPLSTSGPDLTMTYPINGDIIRFSQISISGVSEAAIEVTVNGIQAKIIGNVFSLNDVLLPDARGKLAPVDASQLAKPIALRPLVTRTGSGRVRASS